MPVPSICCLQFVDAFGEEYKTRTRVWTIRPKSKSIAEVKTPTEGSEATAIGASGSSRSSVNNCTQELQGQVSNKVKRKLGPLIENKIRRLILEYDPPDDFEKMLLEGRWLIIEKTEHNTKSVKLLLGDGQRRPDNLVYRNEEQPDLSWLGELEEDEPIFLPGEEEYKQPDLSLF